MNSFVCSGDLGTVQDSDLQRWGPWPAVYSRFDRWAKAGVFQASMTARRREHRHSEACVTEAPTSSKSNRNVPALAGTTVAEAATGQRPDVGLELPGEDVGALLGRVVRVANGLRQREGTANCRDDALNSPSTTEVGASSS